MLDPRTQVGRFLPEEAAFTFPYNPQKQRSSPAFRFRWHVARSRRPLIRARLPMPRRTETASTIHWRYAPDLAKESFVDFLSAYNKVGNPSPFYAEYADEYFTVYADGTLVRTVKKGCVKLAERNDPENQIEQRLRLTPTRIEQTSLIPANVSRLRLVPVLGERVKTGRTDNLLLHWPFDEGMGQTTREQIADVETTVLGATGAFSPGRRTVSR